jgi:hypothetical protein
MSVIIRAARLIFVDLNFLKGTAVEPICAFKMK